MIKTLYKWPMQQRLNIAIPDLNRKVIRFPPEFCKFIVPYAAFELISIPGCEILFQQCHNYEFHMQLFEISVSRDTELLFHVTQPSIFATFMIEGEVSVHNEYGEVISHSKEKTFYVSHSRDVKYLSKLKKGTHRLLVVAFSDEWFISQQDYLPQFSPLVDSLKRGDQDAVLLPFCHIGQTIWRLLEKIMNYTSSNAIERGSGIFHLLTCCLSFYHNLLQSGNYLPQQSGDADGKLLKEYIELNYTTDNVNNISRLIAELGISEWKIKDLSLKHFGKSIHQYVIERRMNKAKELLETTDMSIKDIALTTGYDNACYFTKAFKKYYGLLPRFFRKTGLMTF